MSKPDCFVCVFLNYSIILAAFTEFKLKQIQTANSQPPFQIQSLLECEVPRMGGNICLRLKKTRRMRTLRNFPLAINKRLAWRILETEQQCETLLGGQTRSGEQF